jgi:hypothetical protein
VRIQSRTEHATSGFHRGPAGDRAPVRETIERYGLTRTIDPTHFYPTVDAAVAAFREQFGTDWAPTAGKQPS